MHVRELDGFEASREALVGLATLGLVEEICKITALLKIPANVRQVVLNAASVRGADASRTRRVEWYQDDVADDHRFEVDVLRTWMRASSSSKSQVLLMNDGSDMRSVDLAWADLSVVPMTENGHMH